MTGIALDPAEDLAYVESLLEGNGLPADDVRARPDAFYVARDGGTRVGIGGVETYGDAGLLRSVVVESVHRGEGYGTALCDALESRAASDGVGTLYLLTTTAADFFCDRGYERIDREDAPGAIRATTEFSELCPSTATAMEKRL